MTWTRDAYLHAALDAELGSLRKISSGRACAAFRAAAAIGGLVGAGAITREKAEDLLLDAALDTGLPEHEARGHIRRGLSCGERTPRVLPANRPHEPCSRPSFHSPLRIGQHPARPPKAEVDTLWSASVPVGSDHEVVQWFRRRYGGRVSSFLEQTEVRDLARVAPRDLRLPRWAWSRTGSWAQTGHRLLFRLWDHTGNAISLRARSLDAATTPKSLAPCGFSVRGLVLADPVGERLLNGNAPPASDTQDVVVAEGEPDWLLWSARRLDTEAPGPACFGVEAGAWCQQIADRIPDGARVAIRTHRDEPGERYARQIVTSLHRRCQVFRSSVGEEGASK